MPFSGLGVHVIHTHIHARAYTVFPTLLQQWEEENDKTSPFFLFLHILGAQGGKVSPSCKTEALK